MVSRVEVTDNGCRDKEKDQGKGAGMDMFPESPCPVRIHFWSEKINHRHSEVCRGRVCWVRRKWWVGSSVT